jgi:3-deoxy-D-arabino-heptulosonate 7-phosphate (DAHP) synthase
MVEVHGKPDEALSDGVQCLMFDEYEQMVREVRQIYDVISRNGAA